MQFVPLKRESRHLAASANASSAKVPALIHIKKGCPVGNNLGTELRAAGHCATSASSSHLFRRAERRVVAMPLTPLTDKHVQALQATARGEVFRTYNGTEFKITAPAAASCYGRSPARD